MWCSSTTLVRWRDGLALEVNAQRPPHIAMKYVTIGFLWILACACGDTTWLVYPDADMTGDSDASTGEPHEHPS